MAHIRRSCQSSELSEEATRLLMASWRSKSQSSYNSLFLKWERWCISRSRDPIHGPVGDIANFLAELFQEGYSYSSLNSYRSAISSVHTRIEGLPVGQHPVVRRILKGAYNINPPRPRYKSTWRVSQVITWLDSRQSKDLSLLCPDTSMSVSGAGQHGPYLIQAHTRGSSATPAHSTKTVQSRESHEGIFFPYVHGEH